jgi:hypothetical protein
MIVPLYCCDRCGWAATALRIDAVRDHQRECPACAGTMRLAFQGPDYVPERFPRWEIGLRDRLRPAPVPLTGPDRRSAAPERRSHI